MDDIIERMSIHTLKTKNEDVYNRAISLGCTDLTATILANRTNDVNNLERLLAPTTRDIMDYKLLKDIDKATDIILDHINNNEDIMAVCDMDADGITSASVFTIFFRDVLKYRNYDCILNQRRWGNGVNMVLAGQVLEKKPKLIITFDHGSSNGKEFDYLIDNGVNVIVTDHHELSLTTPPSDRCLAFINPQQEDCNYDKAISGCTVGYLLMLSIADRLKINRNNIHMQAMLALASISVISDSMKLNSITNRALVHTGLKIANSKKIELWKWLAPYADNQLFDYKFYGWTLAPLINSASRMGDSYNGYNIFKAIEPRDIRDALTKALLVNEDRKNLQNEIAKELTDVYNTELEYNSSVVLSITKGSGIQGIVANRFADSEKKPSVIFYIDKDKGTAQGSGRSARGINLRNIYIEIAQLYPEYILGYGGHEEAAGITIKTEFFEQFREMFDSICSRFIKPEETNISKKIEVECRLDTIDYSTLSSIKKAAPYGKGWEAPLFVTSYTVVKAFYVSRPKLKDMVILTLVDCHGLEISTKYFTTGEEAFTLTEGFYVDIVYEVKYNPTYDKGISIDIKKLKPILKVNKN